MKSKSDLAREYFAKFKGESKFEIARMLYKDFPDLFSSADSARCFLRKALLSKSASEIQKERDEKRKPEPAQDTGPETTFKKVRDLLRSKDTRSFDEISDALDIGIGRIRILIQEMIDEGYTLTIRDNFVISSSVIPKAEPTTLSIQKMSTGFYRFGATGDNHLCSSYERLDVLNALYDQYEKEGIKVVYNTGNWIEGEARFNKNDLKEHGIKNQLEYFVKYYPQRSGIITYFIAGDDHEGWYVQREGLDIGEMAENAAKKAGRTDLVYLGYMEADVVIPAKDGKTVIRVLHPGGGSAYAVSYTSQKIVESYQGGEKPDVLLVGHYHKAEYLYNRGVHIVQTGTTQDQSPFMRKKKLAAHLGGWIIEMATDDNGAITRFKQEFFPFYDNGYYQKWVHKWK